MANPNEQDRELADVMKRIGSWASVDKMAERVSAFLAPEREGSYAIMTGMSSEIDRLRAEVAHLTAELEEPETDYALLSSDYKDLLKDVERLTAKVKQRTEQLEQVMADDDKHITHLGGLLKRTALARKVTP